MKTNYLRYLCAVLLAAIGLTANAYYFEVDGIYYNILSEEDRTVEIANNCNGFICSPSAEGVRNLVIPQRVTFGGRTYTIAAIGRQAFNTNDDLISVIIPSSVTTIENSAFDSCDSLISVAIPNSVTTIGDFAFGTCVALSSVMIPNSVTMIGRGAFYWCDALTSMTIPSSVTEIGDYAFSECDNLKDITVDNANPNYASVEGVLYSKNIDTLICCPGGKTAVIVPNSVTTIGEHAFYHCI